MRQLNIFILAFAALLFFASGYILGIGQNLSCGISKIKELDNK